MIQRRNFLIAGALVLAAPLAANIGARLEVPALRRWRVTKRLRAILGPVEGEAAIKAFLEDTLHNTPFETIDDRSLATGFLLATDYFDRGRPANAPISYQGIYDPYFSPCINPLADLT